MSRFWDAYGESYNALQKVGQDQANRQAGSAFASGDYGGAADVLARSGNIDGARTLQDDRQRQAELARESSQKQQAQTVTVIGNGLKALRSIPDDPTNPQSTQAKRQQTFTTQIAPLWKQAGIGDDIIQQTLAHPMDTQSIDVALQAFGQAAERLQYFNTSRGVVGFGPNGNMAMDARDPPAPRPVWKQRTLANGKAEWINLSDPSTWGDTPPNATSGSAGPPGALDPHKFFNEFVLPHEGGLNPADANGAPSNFGINQTANPGVDVRTLTKEGAGQIFTDKYFKASGAANLPPALAAVQADTYYINPTRANQFLQQSGGDPQKYMDLRTAWLDRLVQADPARYGKYAKAWANRNADLRAYAQQAGGSPQPQQDGGQAPLTPPGPASAAAPRGPIPGGIARATGSAGKWDMLHDPKTGVDYRANVALGIYQTLDGKPYAPQGAAKINGGGTPRSLPAMAAARYVAEHPTASSEDLNQLNATIKLTGKAVSDFGTGPQGKTINSLNVAVDHLETLSGLADALHNNNIPMINKFAQAIAVATGKAAPTNFAAAKQIVGDEVVKAIVNGASALGDRAEIAKNINASSSPEQLQGLIKQYKALMAGQLNGYRIQYRNTTHRDDFETKLLPETRRELESIDVGRGRPAAPVAAGNGWKVLKVH